MKYRFHTVDVFTDQIFGGNPLAVFPEADGLSQRQMQIIAREFNLSETVFVQRPRRPDCMNRLRIFTPHTELPFAGHPTLGAAFLLAELGAIYLESDETRVVFEEGMGQVHISLRARAGRVCFTRLSLQITPEQGAQPPGRERLAEILSLAESDFADTPQAVQALGCGLPYLLVNVKNRQAVSRARLDPQAWQRHLADFWAPNIYLYTHDALLPGSQLRARMFAPALGVAEDPATGSAAAALGMALARQDSLPSGRWNWVVEQGFELGRPSFIEVQVDKRHGDIHKVHVGGRCVQVAQGVMEVPPIEGEAAGGP